MVAYSQFALRGGTNIKSGRGIYDSHKLQLAAYAHAFAEMTGRYPDAGFVLYTNAEKGKNIARTADDEGGTQGGVRGVRPHKTDISKALSNKLRGLDLKATFNWGEK
jgi:hypothetical protein